MKEKKFSVNHSEHVKVLDSLTEPLKDQVKQGLALIDGCVNQLAQAKWIFEEINKSIKNSYNDCASCAQDLNNGGRPSSSANKEIKNEREDSEEPPPPPPKGKKTRSVLPMVSGHEIQRPKIKITRLEPETVNRRTPKKSETPIKISARGRGRPRSSSSSSRVSRKEKETSKKSKTTQKKNFSGPKSKHAEIAQFANSKIDLSLVKPCKVKIFNISSMLIGKTRFIGRELLQFENGRIEDAAEKSDDESERKLERDSRIRSRESSPESVIKARKRKYSSSPSPEPPQRPNPIDLFSGLKKNLENKKSESASSEETALSKKPVVKTFSNIIINKIDLKEKLQTTLSKFKQDKKAVAELPTSTVSSSIAAAGLDIDLGIVTTTNGFKPNEEDDGMDIGVDLNFDKGSDDNDDGPHNSPISENVSSTARLAALNAIVLNEDSGPCFNET